MDVAEVLVVSGRAIHPNKWVHVLIDRDNEAKFEAMNFF